jgi:trk system potassium uptake protein TrkA
MKGKIAVIGLGTFGREVAVQLARLGYSVLAVDQNAAAVDAIKDDVDSAVVMDTTDEEALYEARFDEIPVAICAIGADHMEDSILTTALLRQLQVPRIIGRALNDLHARILRQVGAGEVVNPEQEMGRRVALQVARPGFREVFSLAEGVWLAEVPVPPSFVNQSLAGMQVRRRYNLTVIGVKRVSESTPAPAAQSEAAGEASESGRHPLLDRPRTLLLNPPPKDPFRADDVLLVIGAETDIKRLSGLG